jgi:hypothetical protein
MSADYFKTALLGPILNKPMAVSGSCAECVASTSPAEAQSCAGFGPGCFGMRRATAPASTPDDLRFRFRSWREIL